MNESDDKPALGRPPSYDPAKLPEVRALAEHGATDEEIAKYLSIGIRTLYRWKHQYPDFWQALKVGKAAADDRVERSLYQMAVGYRRKTVKIMQHEGVVIEHPHVEDVLPNVTAAIFWLKNRRPAEWREKIDHALTGTLTLEKLVEQSGMPAK